MSAPRAATIIDYGMGNIRSLAHALERAGASVTVSDDPRDLERATRLVIPGQGAFGQAMARLETKNLIEPIRAHLAAGRPLLGVCLGLQVLYRRSEEAPGIAGLGVLEGDVQLIPLAPGIKRPHMGWAPVHHDGGHPVLAAIPSGEAFYFVHSYAARSAPGCARATATHGIELIAAVARDGLVATQFHPEKSQAAGETLLRAWLSV